MEAMELLHCQSRDQFDLCKLYLVKPELEEP